VPGWLERGGESFRVAVRLTPKAACDAIDGSRALADGRVVLAARVRAAPEKGRANTALVRLLARAAGIAPSAVTIVSGDTGRVKVLQLSGDPGRLVESAGEAAQKDR